VQPKRLKDPFLAGRNRFTQNQEMAKRSAGLLMFRRRRGELQVLLAHPGGPLWSRKDQGAWSIPKGEYGEEEDPLAAAQREFAEETGWTARGEFLALGEARQSGGKLVTVWAFEGDAEPSTLRSNTFSMEWPPRSGNMREFPEIDRAGWFSLALAQEKILTGQAVFLDRLLAMLHA
jgi:predicted NUDIX family NTP pyrophosphohydrolase